MHMILLLAACWTLRPEPYELSEFPPYEPEDVVGYLATTPASMPVLGKPPVAPVPPGGLEWTKCEVRPFGWGCVGLLDLSGTGMEAQVEVHYACTRDECTPIEAAIYAQGPIAGVPMRTSAAHAYMTALDPPWSQEHAMASCPDDAPFGELTDGQAECGWARGLTWLRACAAVGDDPCAVVGLAARDTN